MRHLLFPCPLSRGKTVLLCSRNRSAAAVWQLGHVSKTWPGPRQDPSSHDFSPRPFERDDNKKPDWGDEPESPFDENVNQDRYQSLILFSQHSHWKHTFIIERLLSLNVFCVCELLFVYHGVKTFLFFNHCFYSGSSKFMQLNEGNICLVPVFLSLFVSPSVFLLLPLWLDYRLSDPPTFIAWISCTIHAFLYHRERLCSGSDKVLIFVTALLFLPALV